MVPAAADGAQQTAAGSKVRVSTSGLNKITNALTVGVGGSMVKAAAEASRFAGGDPFPISVPVAVRESGHG
jgi:hypothetical protein